MEKSPKLSLFISLFTPILPPQNCQNNPKTCRKSPKKCRIRVDITPIYTSQQAYIQDDKAKTCRCVDKIKIYEIKNLSKHNSIYKHAP